MFEMNPGAMETEVVRRHEVLRGTMKAARGQVQMDRRVSGVVRFRHVVATLVAALL